MSSKKTEDLLPVSAVSGTDLIHVVQGGVSKRATAAQLKSFVSTGAGASAPGVANVNAYLNEGDTNYDGAISRCLLANNHAYFPAKPALADPNNYYRTTTTVMLQNNQSLSGDGPGVSKLVCNTPNVPTVTLGSNIYWYSISGLTIAHAGTATSGGDGIFQGQGATDWVDNCCVENVLLAANYNGANLGKAFSGRWLNVVTQGNVYDGIVQTTNGAATVNGVAVGGPLQTVFIGCAAKANGHDGFSYKSTGSVPNGSSMGTLVDCESFANGHHGVSAIGSAAHPLHAIRIDGGFFGEDTVAGIYLDTYAPNHSICPQFLELAGSSNIYLTANNTNTYIRVTQCTGAYNDGIISIGASNVMIDGGHFINNGRNPTSGVYSAGIRIDGGSAHIHGVRTQDTGSGLQDYGISVNGDNVLITGCRLDGNAIAPIVWATPAVNSLVTGCFPASVNTGGAGTTITGNLTVTGNITATGDVIGNRVSAGAIPSGASSSPAMYAPYFIASNSVILTSPTGQFDAGAGGSLVCRDATINRSFGVGAGASGVSGQINTSGRIISGAGLTANGSLTGVSSFSISALDMNFGGITNVGSISMSGNIAMNGYGITTMGNCGGASGSLTMGNIAALGEISAPTLKCTVDVLKNGVAYTHP